MIAHAQSAVAASAATGQTLMALGGDDLPSRILFWGLVLLGLIVLAGVVLLWVRRRVSPPGRRGPMTFSLEALEAMRASRELSDEEFRRLRRAALPLDVQQMAEEAGKDPNCTLSLPSNGDDEDN